MILIGAFNSVKEKKLPVTINCFSLSKAKCNTGFGESIAVIVFIE